MRQGRQGKEGAPRTRAEPRHKNPSVALVLFNDRMVQTNCRRPRVRAGTAAYYTPLRACVERKLSKDPATTIARPAQKVGARVIPKMIMLATLEQIGVR